MGEDELWGEASKRKMLVIVSIGDFQRLQSPVEVSTGRKDKSIVTSRRRSKEKWVRVIRLISNSLLLAVHGQGDVCVIELNVDIVGNQLMKLLHSFSLDKLSGFTPWKQTESLWCHKTSSQASSEAHRQPSTRVHFNVHARTISSWKHFWTVH